jgi:hypothetical protein
MEFEGSRESPLLSAPEQLIHILGIVYTHHKTGDGGDMYLTQFGLQNAKLLEIENWYEKEWYESHREKLEGTSAVYRVRTKEIGGKSLELVVKNSRVGEDIPLDTHTLIEFISAEFNSPWEEFAMVMEMRESQYGPSDIRIRTQFPLAIYVPPEKMQLWQSGRSVSKINSIINQNPGIEIDILKQYKLIYGWISGKNSVEAFQEIGLAGVELDINLRPITKKVMTDMDKKGYIVTDMKPSHIIIDEVNLEKLAEIGDKNDPAVREKQRVFLLDLIHRGEYSVIDYELLIRTPAYDEYVRNLRRSSYLIDMKDRFKKLPLPANLSGMEVFNVPYIFGRVESTGGLLWVVGRNPKLFDYFLPERWRTTHHWKLSGNNEIYYTLTKDNIHLVWKASHVGENPPKNPDNERSIRKSEFGFNSPFEEFSIADFLNKNGVPTVYMRAVYMTGSVKQEATEDESRFLSHTGVKCPDGQPALSREHNYITIRGYYNGPDNWVAEQKGQLCRPVDLMKALHNRMIDKSELQVMTARVVSRLEEIGYDGCLLEPNDMIITYDPKGELIKDKKGNPEIRITNFEFIRKL